MSTVVLMDGGKNGVVHNLVKAHESCHKDEVK